MRARLPAGEVRLQRQKAAHLSWALTPDPSARTEPARAAADRRHVEAADPGGSVRAQIEAARGRGDSREVARLESMLARRVESARKAFFAELALKSVQARRQRRVAPGVHTALDRSETHPADEAPPGEAA